MQPPNESQRERMRQAYADAAATPKQVPTSMIPPEPVELAPGQIIGKCEIVRELGRGGMGAVYLARHTTLDVPVAVKILPPLVAWKSPDYAERFLREARLAARIKHPNVLAVMDADRDETTGLYYMVTEFADGGSVGDRLGKGPLAEAKAVAVVAGIAKALQAASRQGIVHRDIKPDNILISKDGRVKLADLGLAKDVAQDADITKSSSAIGTPYYMSPEQIQDSKRVDIRSDIYSLGATFFHLLTGQPPFPGSDVYGVMHKVMTAPTPDPRGARPELADATSRLCMKMMEKDVARRYQTPSEILTDLAKGGGPAPIELEPAAPAAAGGAAAPVFTPAASRQVDLTGEVAGGRRTWIWGAAAAAVVLVAVVASGVFSPEKRAEPASKPVVADAGLPGDAAAEKPAEPADEPAPAAAPGESLRPAPPADEAPRTPVRPVEPAAPLPRKPLSEGAVLALSFEDATLSVRGNDRLLRDLSGRAGEGRIVGGVTATEGRVGRALQFNGATGFVEFPAMRERTVAMWVRPEGLVQAGWFDGGAPEEPGRAFQVGLFQPRGFKDGALNSYGLFLGFRHLDVVVPHEELRTGWHHVVIAWNGDTAVQVVLDGQPLDGHVVVADAPFSARPAAQPFALPHPPRPDESAATLVGRIRSPWWNLGQDHFRGALDEVAVWERALTLEEMLALHGRAAKGESYCEEIGREVAEAAARAAAAEESARTPPAPDPAPAKPADTAGDPGKPARPPARGDFSLLDGCVAAFDFEPGSIFKNPGKSESLVKDRSGSGNNAHVHYAPKFAEGKAGDAVWFDGKKDFLSFGPVTQRAVALWVKAGAKDDMAFYDGSSEGDAAATRLKGMILATYTEKNRFAHWPKDSSGFVFGAMQVDALVSVPSVENVWHHVVVSVDGDKVLFVIDGKARKGAVSDAAKPDLAGREQPFRFPDDIKPAPRQAICLGRGRGALLGRICFEGALDDVIVWDRPLTTAEIELLAKYASKGKSMVAEIAQRTEK